MFSRFKRIPIEEPLVSLMGTQYPWVVSLFHLR